MIIIITAIILAAGSSKRMGKQKLLLPLKGGTIIENVIKTVAGCGSFGEMLAVYKSQEVLDKIKGYDIKKVYNPIAEEGQSTSIISGIKNANADTEAYMFIVGDQPFITLDVINKLICTWMKNRTSIIVPRYDGKNGMPTIFPAEFTKDLMNITGDIGGRKIIQDNPDKAIYVDFNDSMAGFDIDTSEDYIILMNEILVLKKPLL